MTELKDKTQPGLSDRSNTRHPFFLGMLALATVAFGALLLGFWQPIFWAVVLGVMFRPVMHRLNARLPGRPSVAAGLTVMLIFCTVLVPALLVASAVAAEGTQLLARFQSGELNTDAGLQWLQGLLPQINDWAAGIGIDLSDLQSKLSGAALTGSRFVAGLVLSTGQNIAQFMLLFFLMLYLLFFVVRDGDKLLGEFEKAMPLSDQLERRLARKFGEVARATLKGTIIVGLVQGTLGGIIFAVLSIEGAAFWGCVMVILSVIPAVGPGLIWLPAAILLIAGGKLWSGVILIGFGVLVIGLVDNLLRPLLVGRDTKMPDYLVLLSTLGGIAMFGITGFVLGPILAALFLALWQMFAAETTHDS
jgi:predicted PurR-regulated permease PerM